LIEAGNRLGVTVLVHDIRPGDSLPTNLGDIILWRSSSLGKSNERVEVMSALAKKHPLINRCLVQLPQSTEKSFQQEYVQKKTTAVRCIPTFRFQTKKDLELAINSGVLRYPFIQKPNQGSKGKGVLLIREAKDISGTDDTVKQQVYQNFIVNTGDYRVFILGGRMLGAIKRTASNGGFLNNISQGGSAMTVTDPKVLTRLRRMSTTIASIFELTICGVDIIFDEISKEYYFLEVNTAPQWEGFQKATGVNVAFEIIGYCQRHLQRGLTPTPLLVLKEYRSQVHLLGDKAFHFLSRLYLWSGDAEAKAGLDTLRPAYIGNTEGQYRARLRYIFTRIPEHGDHMVSREARQIYFKKYPLLESYLGVLFKYLFAQKIYGLDLRPYIQELVSTTDLLKLKGEIEQDDTAMRVLSTYAINYLYMVDHYLNTPSSAVNPTKYYKVGSTYPGDSFELQIYFFTHCIIGASKFYSEPIKPADLDIYKKMLGYIESTLLTHFKTISLDNKCEFLVCAKICGYTSTLEDVILKEADSSLAPDGNFLIDTLNSKASPDERNDFLGSEHRNVLYIMSQLHYQRQP
jgi:glutathione synthase/RimK-type ligase-like ATP-grasp enzyme